MADSPSFSEVLGTVIFVIAVIHTFLVGQFSKLSQRFSKNQSARNFFHLLSEVEIVFGFAAGVFILILGLHSGFPEAIRSIEALSFAEPIFVFVIMTIASTRPVLTLAMTVISMFAKLLPLPKAPAFYSSTLVFGALVGSFITEPAAMTVCALLLEEKFFSQKMSMAFKYATLGLLFVNISIGGTLTHFAAPPVLMVAKKWDWDSYYLLSHFGWKAILAILISTAVTIAIFWKELRKFDVVKRTGNQEKIPHWVKVLSLVFLILTVFSAHHPVLCVGLLLFFLGVVRVSDEHQETLRIKESLLVAFFLGGLVILGSYQAWWLKPLLSSLNEFQLFLGSTILTGLVDNAALTYLGSQVEGLSDRTKYALVAGAVTGGGLTVIANAPNLVGYAVLKDRFGADGIQPSKLLLGALGPTLVAFVLFWTL